ncbi:MAG: lipopolysaccharide kinase InaA family protein [Breznakibacter sp.]
MRRHLEVHPAYKAKRPYLENAIGDFDHQGQFLQRSRNHVKVVAVGDECVVIKSFVRITWANRIIYGLFRKSKAQRAYENALLLIGHGIDTPFPLAYADWRRGPLLYRSFFVSKYVEYKSCKELFEHPLPECADALGQFGRFLNRLHRSGIFHGDLNLNNVLYSVNNTNYSFWLIDNNRLRLKSYTRRRGLRNLRRIRLPLDKLAIVAMEYAAAGRTDEYDTALGILFYRHLGKMLGTGKRALKQWRHSLAEQVGNVIARARS